ncbi:MAG: 3-dehydroquinate synthase [Candidatus Saganbacteria bacterium]|nr:3-dehydroquinate synthase [Candidatus Saganbacteria bacterium]
MRKIPVRTSSAFYEIIVGSQILSKLGEALTKLKLKNRVIVISDFTVGRLYAGVVKHSLRSKGFKSEIITIPSGEKTKTLEMAKKLYKKLLELKAHRDCALIALGGGVIGDLTGFVAATYMRGVDLINVPTTLLSQVDASIGGKTGVNLEEAKNIVGVFCQPRLVYADTAVLITLPAKELRNGLAEIIKYGVIKDFKLFEYLENKVFGLKSPKLLNPGDFKDLLGTWENIISISASIKAKVVAADEKETKGQRVILNFGHTIGHALEALSEYKGITHGEAVAIGMVAALKIANKMKMIKADTEDRIKKLISAVNLPVSIKGIEADDIITKLILDKKVRDGRINFVLPTRIGSVIIRNDIPVKILRESLKEIGAG